MYKIIHDVMSETLELKRKKKLFGWTKVKRNFGHEKEIHEFIKNQNHKKKPLVIKEISGKNS
jgi:hypothetical protein